MAVDIKVERPTAVEVTEDGTNLVVRPGDATNKAIRVSIVAGAAGATSVTINDPTITTQKLAVDVNGRIGINNFPASQAVTGAFFQATQPVSIAATVAVNLSQVGASAVTLGQKVMASSIPVVIASDQSAVPVSGTVTANQGTANTAANAWPAKVTDGTNTAAVKAASTAAAAADPALVVALSPNN